MFSSERDSSVKMLIGYIICSLATPMLNLVIAAGIGAEVRLRA